MRRLGAVGGELGRKAIHVGVGVFIAAMPIFMNTTEIIVVNSLFFLGLVGIKFTPFKFFTAYESVNRWTIGQYLYPLSIILLAFIVDNALVFSFAVLELALADGFAALMGKKYGKHEYHIPGGVKTYVGSLTYFLVTLTLVVLFVSIEGSFTAQTLILILVGSFMLTVVEGMIAGGFDNLAIPILMAVLLQDIS